MFSIAKNFLSLEGTIKFSTNCILNRRTKSFTMKFKIAWERLNSSHRFL